MRELRLRYLIDLASNIGQRSRAEAQALEAAQKVMQGAIAGTNNKLTDWTKLNASATKETDLLQAAVTGVTNKFTQARLAADQMRSATDRLGTTERETVRDTEALDRALTRLGSNTSTERQARYMRQLADSAGAAESRAARLQRALGRGVSRGLEAAPEAAGAVAAAGFAAQRVTAPFVRDYSNLESATTNLRVAMMDRNGQVSKDFEGIAAEAKKLGEKLPGGTKDFMLGARALIEQGVPTGVIKNGGLRGASYFGALMDMDQYRAATTIAKVREAHGLRDDELVPAADLMQRGRYGFGIEPADYLEVAKYAAPTYNAMKLTNLDKMRELLAIQGLAAQVGLEGSSFGTNYSQMLVRTAQINSRTNKGSKEAKEVKALLAEHGIHMEFFNKEGEWAGNRNMIEQLQKLAPLSTADRLKVSNRLFGVEAGRPALRLADAGVAGYDKALETIDSQASLDDRIELKMSTFAAKLEALGGTIENVRAQIAAQFGEAAKPAMDRMADFVSGPLQGYFERNPGAGTAVLGGLGLGASYLGGSALMRLLRARGAAAGGEGAAAAAAAAAEGTRAAALGQVARSAFKFGAPLAVLGGGVDAVRVLADPEADKARELTRVGVTTGGGLAGAVGGAALGSIVPGVGTVLGGLIGGALGGFGGSALTGSLFDWLWSKKDPAQRAAATPVTQAEVARAFPSGLQVPSMDLLTLSAPGAALGTTLQAGKTTELKVGEGVLRLDLVVRDERVDVRPSVPQQPSLIKINPGGTDPGSFTGFGR